MNWVEIEIIIECTPCKVMGKRKEITWGWRWGWGVRRLRYKSVYISKRKSD